MARRIVITSGKGGVGKTTLCASLGQMLAKNGNKVVLLDVDIGLNNLDVVTGIDNRIIFDIVDVIEGKCRPKQALVQDVNTPTLFILPSAHTYNVGKVNTKDIISIVNYLSQNFDYILIDCPAGIDLGFQRAVFCANEALIVTTPHISAIRDANKVASILSNFQMTNISLVINRVRQDFVQSNEMLNPFDIAETLKLPISGIIPESDDISISSSINGSLENVHDESQMAFLKLASNVHNGKFLNNDNKQGFFQKIKNNLIKRK